MYAEVNWEHVAKNISKLYESSKNLERLFPGRKFTLDGHLVGSIGEVLAAYMFNLSLTNASNKGFDAISDSGLKVEIKYTQGKLISIRHEAQHVIALCRRDEQIFVAYNGPGDKVWSSAGERQSNGQRPISISKLIKLNTELDQNQQIKQIHQSPI